MPWEGTPRPREKSFRAGSVRQATDTAVPQSAYLVHGAPEAAQTLIHLSAGGLKGGEIIIYIETTSGNPT